jgi:methionine-rich copper-binding protein CopC
VAADRRNPPADATRWYGTLRTGRVASSALLTGLLLLRPATSHAHAFLDHAEPRVGSTVASPAALTLHFTEPVEPAFSRLEIVGSDGAPVKAGSVEHPAPAVLRVTLPPLPPGDYTVEWAVVSVDTHATAGRFTFSVKRP